jgi:hypothetical protein
MRVPSARHHPQEEPCSGRNATCAEQLAAWKKRARIAAVAATLLQISKLAQTCRLRIDRRNKIARLGPQKTERLVQRDDTKKSNRLRPSVSRNAGDHNFRASGDEGTAMVGPYSHVVMMSPMGRTAERQLSTNSVALRVLPRSKVSSAAGFWSAEATCRRPIERQA